MNKLKSLLKQSLLILCFSLIIFLIGLLISFLICYFKNCKLENILFYEGIIVTIIGVLMSLRGNPSGSNIGSIGQNNATQVSFENLEVTRLEREMNPYHKGFRKNNIVTLGVINITIILSGIFLLISSLILS